MTIARDDEGYENCEVPENGGRAPPEPQPGKQASGTRTDRRLRTTAPPLFHINNHSATLSTAE